MADKFVCSIPECGKPHRAYGFCKSHARKFKLYGDPLGGRTANGAPLQFITEIALKHAGNDCLKWPFGTDGNGRGMAWIDGRHELVNRYVCTLIHGDPPTPQHHAAHSCGKGHESCISPNHLSWKTKAENEADKLVHGTHNRGERHGRSKLTEAEVRKILDLKGIRTQSEIGSEFNVSEFTVRAIHQRRIWAWLPD